METTGASFDFLLLTHLHPGHAFGALSWLKAHPQLQIIAGVKKVPANRRVEDGEIIIVGDLSVYCMHTPGHSEADVSYLVTQCTPTSDKTPLLFSGDILSCGGAGPANDLAKMQSSLTMLRSLPNETLIFPGHEATAQNLAFAKMLEPDNPFVTKKLDWVKDRKGQVNVGSPMSEERLYNPFLRVTLPYFKHITGESDPTKVLGKLLKLRDELIE
jgi:hydroxyacylglutathione hydrolase